MKNLIICLLIFAIAFYVKAWNLGMQGRWSDEQAIVEKGYRLVSLIINKDFDNKFWYIGGADHPPFAYYLFGIVSNLDYKNYDPKTPPSNDIKVIGSPVYDYDFKYSRLFIVILSSFTSVMIYLIGRSYFSKFVGITSAIILTLLPHSLGFSQFVNLEIPILFFFTLCFWSSLIYLKTEKKLFLYITAVLSGINILIKESNILILPLIFSLLSINFIYNKKLNINHIIQYVIILFITLFILWPMPWLHIGAYLQHLRSLWLGSGLVPELIFSKLMGARFFYYFMALGITTPLIIVILSIFSFTKLIKKNNFNSSAILLWFIIPLFMSFFHHRQHMIRYIIEIYAPLSIIAALGYEFIIKKIFKKNLFLQIMPLVIYLIISLVLVYPYYLNYYNELVGGTFSVNKNKLFFLGWYGEGLKNPGIYLEKNAKDNMKIGVILNLEPGLYKSNKLRYEKYNPQKMYDYLILNKFMILRLNFDKNTLKKNYKLVYIEKMLSGEIAYVYKRK